MLKLPHEPSEPILRLVPPIRPTPEVKPDLIAAFEGKGFELEQPKAQAEFKGLPVILVDGVRYRLDSYKHCTNCAVFNRGDCARVNRVAAAAFGRDCSELGLAYALAD